MNSNKKESTSPVFRIPEFTGSVKVLSFLNKPVSRNIQKYPESVPPAPQLGRMNKTMIHLQTYLLLEKDV